MLTVRCIRKQHIITAMIKRTSNKTGVFFVITAPEMFFFNSLDFQSHQGLRAAGAKTAKSGRLEVQGGAHNGALSHFLTV